MRGREAAGSRAGLTILVLARQVVTGLPLAGRTLNRYDRSIVFRPLTYPKIRRKNTA